MKLEFTEDKIKALEIEFNQLKTIEEKFEFWTEKLEIPYYMWPKYEFQSIKNFQIKANSYSEKVRINEMLLDQYINRVDQLAKTKRVYNFEQMKDSFLHKYGNITNKHEYIEHEIEEVKRRVAEKEGCIKDIFEATKSFYDSGYNNFYFKNIKPDLERAYEADNLISLMNGYVLAQYHIFLTELIKKPKAKKEEVTLKKKLLILDYLGILKGLDMENTKKAKLLSILLNQSEQNIREYLSDMYSREKEVKTKENLNYVHTLFEELNLKDHNKQIIKDIEKFIRKD